MFFVCGQKDERIKVEPSDNEIKQKLIEPEEIDAPIYTVRVNNILSTSFATESNNPYRNYPYRAIDSDPLTSWNEGIAGPGIGERLWISFKNKIFIDKIVIMPGYYDEQWYYYNNRIKCLTLELKNYSMEVDFNDGMIPKEIVFSEKKITSIIGITIQEVYKGHTYDDTCIAELQFFYQEKKIELDNREQLSELKQKEAGWLDSPNGMIIKVRGMMGYSYSQYFYEDGIYVFEGVGYYGSNFHKQFGTWSMKEKSAEIVIHITSECYVKGIGESNLSDFGLYPDYEYIEEKIDIIENINWASIQLDNQNSSYEYELTIIDISSSDYTKREQGYTAEIDQNIRQYKEWYKQNNIYRIFFRVRMEFKKMIY